MSINFKAENEKPNRVLIDNVGKGFCIEFITADNKIVIGEIFCYGPSTITIIRLDNRELYEMSYGTSCNIVEDIEIHYKYYRKQYTDKERLDFLDKHCIDGTIECCKNAVFYKTNLRWDFNTKSQVKTIRPVIDKLLEYFGEK